MGFGVHLARLLSAAVTGLIVLAGAALVLPPGPADLSARLPHAISEAAAVLQRAAGLADGGAQVAIRTDTPSAPVEAQSHEAQVAVAPDEPADAVLSSPGQRAPATRLRMQDAMTVRDAAPTSSPQEVQNDAQVTAKDDASIQPADEVAGATRSEPATDTESADGGTASVERQTGDEAGVAVAAPAAEPLTTTADTPVQAPEDVVAGAPSVPAMDTEGAVEDATTTELQARDAASREAAEPKAEPTETSPTAPSADEMVRVTAERLNMRDGPRNECGRRCCVRPRHTAQGRRSRRAVDQGTGARWPVRLVKRRLPRKAVRWFGRGGLRNRPAREAMRLGAAEQAAEPVSSAAAALADLASEVPRRN